MIVAVARIDGNDAGAARAQRLQRVARRPIIDADHDDAFDFAPQRQRVGAPRKGVRHPVHVALLARGDPAGQIFAGVFRQLRRGDAAKIESERLGPDAQAA